ncbi:MAG: glycoside hydrolase family 88 protein [Bryobacteraceae bacterium]
MRDGAELRCIAERAADRLLPHPWKLWFWGDSIGLDGLLDAAEVTGSGKYLGYVYGLLKGWIAREPFRSQFDYTAAGVALLRVYERTGDVALLEAARRHAEYMAGFRRTDRGAYVRYENAAIELPPELPPDHPAQARPNGPAVNGGPCVFVDSVHFDGPFFAKLYQVTQEERFRGLAFANVMTQVDLLYDPHEHLFHHFWIERTGRPNGVLWARGNGWGLLGIALTLEGTGTASEEGAHLGNVLRRGIQRVAELQDSSGAWHTILNDPEAYLEASTAPFFVDIIARAARLGLVDACEYDSVLEAAMNYTLEHVSVDGTFTGVSYETFPSTRPEHYRQMPRGALVPWGQGPLLTAIRSYLELRRAASAQAREESHAAR